MRRTEAEHARDARDGDYGAAFLRHHSRQHRMGQQVIAVEIDPDHLAPFFRGQIDGAVHRAGTLLGPAVAYASGVDQNVDSAISVLGLVPHSLDIYSPAEVADHHPSFAFPGFDLRDDCFERRGGPPRTQDFCPLLGEAHHAGTPHTRSGPRNQGDLSFKPLRHVRFAPWLIVMRRHLFFITLNLLYESTRASTASL